MITDAIRLIRRAQVRHVELATGQGQRTLRTSASRSVSINIADSRKLPVQLFTGNIQNSTGQFYIIPGFSDPTGPDV